MEKVLVIAICSTIFFLATAFFIIVGLMEDSIKDKKGERK